MSAFEWKCSWGDVDPAGIAYYPRLVVAMHQAGEEYMADLGIPYWELSDRYGIDMPVVAMDMEFRRPVFVGDVISISVETEIGNKSLGMEFTAEHEDGATAYIGSEQHVAVTSEKESQELPEEMRTILTDAQE